MNHGKYLLNKKMTKKQYAEHIHPCVLQLKDLLWQQVNPPAAVLASASHYHPKVVDSQMKDTHVALFLICSKAAQQLGYSQTFTELMPPPHTPELLLTKM